MNTELLDQLRADLSAAEFTTGVVRSTLGQSADDARLRGVLSPARHVLAQADTHPVAGLIRLFLLGDALSAAELTEALPRLGVGGSLELGLIAARGAAYAATLSLNPIEIAGSGDVGANEHWWILSDLDDHLRGGPAAPHHVMGVGGATRSLLAQASLDRVPAGEQYSALDLGTGCGIVALHLARAGYERVVATDISERALTLARANAQLNSCADLIDFRQGDMFSPVAGEDFDLILSNPPFVITPRTHGSVPRYEYRDAGRNGDELIMQVVHEGPAHLRDGGTLLCLANWEAPWGENGLARVRGWIEHAARSAGTLHAWVIERDRIDPIRYAETWARDGGAHSGTAAFDAFVTAWVQDFAARRVSSIGLGSIRIQRDGAGEREGVIRLEPAAGAIASGAGVHFAAAFRAGVLAQQMTQAQLLATHWVREPTVVEVREHTPGEESPRAMSLRTDRPVARTVIADPLLAAAVGACDGELSLGQIVGALATLLEVSEPAVRDALCAEVRELCWMGMLTPAGGAGAQR